MADTPPAQKNRELLVKKSNGDLVPFEEEKLRHSLAKAGTAPASIEFIVKEIRSMIVPGISTRKIYQRAFSMLKKESQPSAARYKLKRAIMELGPSGFPFERYVGELLQDQGYQVEIGVHEQGRCITHEVDIVGEKENKRIAVECKFGNTKDKKLDVKVALYIHSRFQDLANRWSTMPEHAGKEFQGWIVTNGQFSGDAQTYGTCAGLHLVSWDFPGQGNLKDLIDVCHLHPVTSLTTLKKREKDFVIHKGIILCRDLLNRDDLFEEMNFTKYRKKKAIDEILGLCG
ncbi:MAG: restriction endonuclease [Bacteroidota bacterium]